MNAQLDPQNACHSLAIVTPEEHAECQQWIDSLQPRITAEPVHGFFPPWYAGLTEAQCWDRYNQEGE